MYARYQSETKEPNQLQVQRTAIRASYESVGQMKADMADPRYATDSAFRKWLPTR